MSTGQDRARKLEALNNEYESLIAEKASIERKEDALCEKLSTSERLTCEADRKSVTLCAELDQAMTKLAEIKQGEAKEGVKKNIQEQGAVVAALENKVAAAMLEVEKCKQSLEYGARMAAEMDAKREMVSERAAQVAAAMHELSKQ